MKPPRQYTGVRSQISTPRLLTAGKKYFFRMRHLEGSSNDFATAAVRIANPPGPANGANRDLRYAAAVERQMVSLVASSFRSYVQVRTTRRGRASVSSRRLL